MSWIRDVFGNSIALVDFLEPAATLTIVNDVIGRAYDPVSGRVTSTRRGGNAVSAASTMGSKPNVVDVYRTAIASPEGAATAACVGRPASLTPDPQRRGGHPVEALCQLVYRVGGVNARRRYDRRGANTWTDARAGHWAPAATRPR